MERGAGAASGDRGSVGNRMLAVGLGVAPYPLARAWGRGNDKRDPPGEASYVECP